jgi:hypothetical protein
MSDHYILDGKKAVKTDLITWAKWFGNHADRHVADETCGDVRVSTVFLGLDHSWGGGPPLLFETMVFGGDNDQDQERYTTWEQAEIGHKSMCEKVFK